MGSVGSDDRGPEDADVVVLGLVDLRGVHAVLGEVAGAAEGVVVRAAKVIWKSGCFFCTCSFSIALALCCALDLTLFLSMSKKEPEKEQSNASKLNAELFLPLQRTI